MLLHAQEPPIEKMDASLATLKACKHLSLSTNNIEKIGSLAGLESLEILSLGKNQIKKQENLDGVAETLEELWISYNLIERLTNIDKLPKLRVLYMSNNKLENFKELDKLAGLQSLAELLLVGNPLHASAEKPDELGCEYRIEVPRAAAGQAGRHPRGRGRARRGEEGPGGTGGVSLDGFVVTRARFRGQKETRLRTDARQVGSIDENAHSARQAPNAPAKSRILSSPYNR